MKRAYIVIILAVFIIAITYLSVDYYKTFYGPLNSFKKIQVGMDYNELIKQYGKPDYVAYNQKELERYKQYLVFYPKPNKIINKMVVVYEIGPIFIMYLYINTEDKIEYIHKGKT